MCVWPYYSSIGSIQWRQQQKNTRKIIITKEWVKIYDEKFNIKFTMQMCDDIKHYTDYTLPPTNQPLSRGSFLFIVAMLNTRNTKRITTFQINHYYCINLRWIGSFGVDDTLAHTHSLTHCVRCVCHFWKLEVNVFCVGLFNSFHSFVGYYCSWMVFVSWLSLFILFIFYINWTQWRPMVKWANTRCIRRKFVAVWPLLASDKLLNWT